jgi:hypothetical protein
MPVAGFGCSVRTYDESRRGVVSGHLQLDRPLSPSDPEPFAFSYLIKYNMERRADWPILIMARDNIARIAGHVQFTPPALPVKVWWLDVADSLDIGLDQPEANTLPIDSAGYYVKDRDDAPGHRYYGLDWQW